MLIIFDIVSYYMYIIFSMSIRKKLSSLLVFRSPNRRTFKAQMYGDVLFKQHPFHNVIAQTAEWYASIIRKKKQRRENSEVFRNPNKRCKVFQKSATKVEIKGDGTKMWWRRVPLRISRWNKICILHHVYAFITLYYE